MSDFSITIEEPEHLNRFDTWLKRFVPRFVNSRISMANKNLGHLFLSDVIRNSTRPPGPRRITGQYVAAWTLTEKRVKGITDVTVSTRAPQWRRLEYGFVGVDSRGRHYNQAPRPHIRPARDATLRHARLVYGKAVEEAWKAGLQSL